MRVCVLEFDANARVALSIIATYYRELVRTTQNYSAHFMFIESCRFSLKGFTHNVCTSILSRLF